MNERKIKVKKRAMEFAEITKYKAFLPETFMCSCGKRLKFFINCLQRIEYSLWEPLSSHNLKYSKLQDIDNNK